MENLKEKIEQVIENIQEVTELFYQNQDEHGYEKLNILIGKLMNITNDLLEYKKENPDKDIEEGKLSKALMEALQALESKDTVLLADILQYELLEHFHALKEKI